MAAGDTPVEALRKVIRDANQLHRRLATIADVDDTYDERTSTDLTDNKQERFILLKFTPKCSARTFKFRFSNTLTEAATAAGYTMAPFRISEVVVYFAQRESDQANAYANE